MHGIDRRRFLRTAALGGMALGSAALAGTAAPVVLSRIARAQGSYPTKPVRFIVPLAPGGAVDFVARLVGEGASQDLGQPVVVENRTGAGGTIGIEAAIRSEADGYTVLVTNDNVASAPHVQQLPKDYTADLVPVGHLIRQSQVLAVHPSLGVGTLEEFVALAKQRPELGVATSGVGSNQHVLLETFARTAGIKLTHVPYRGGGQAIGELVAGHTQIGWLGPTAVLPHVKAGKLRVLAQSARERSPTVPDAPTLTERGIDVVLEAWVGAFVPAGTPAEIVARLNAAIDKALADPAVRQKLEGAATDPVGGGPEVLAAQYREDAEKYARLVKEFGITTKS